MKWSTLSFVGLLLALLLSVGSPVPATSDGELAGTFWRAVAIDGKPVTGESNAREPHLVFSSEGRVSGSTGCNRVAGAYEKDGTKLRFGQMVSTKMACPTPVSLVEQSFLQALGSTAAARLSGNTLELQDAAGQVLMRLEAR